MKKISKELFIITISVLMVFLAIVIIYFKIFMPDYYIKWLDNKINLEGQALTRLIESDQFTYKEYYDRVNKNENEFNAKLQVFNEYSENVEEELWYNQDWYKLIISYQDNTYIRYIDDANIKREGFPTIGQTVYLYDTDELEKMLNYIDYPDENPAELAVGVIRKVDPLIGQKKLEKIHFDDYYKVLGVEAEVIKVFDEITYDGESNYYRVVISRPPHVLNIFIRALDEMFVIVFFIMLSMSLILFYIFHRKITLPLQRVNESAKRMSKLDLNEEITVDSKNEIGQLANSLNVMSHNLNVTLDDLKNEIEIKKDFVANVSHELKTPLSVMLCYAEMLEDGTKESESIANAKVIQEEIHRMKEMITSMLKLSQLERGEKGSNESLIEVRHLVSNVLSKLEPFLTKRNLRIKNECDDTQISFDLMNASIIFDNVIGNAVKYAKEGTTITIFLEEGQLRVSNIVKNSDFDSLRVFEPFYKGDGSHNEDGTGLGLSLVASILNQNQCLFGASLETNTFIMLIDLRKKLHQ